MICPNVLMDTWALIALTGYALIRLRGLHRLTKLLMYFIALVLEGSIHMQSVEALAIVTGQRGYANAQRVIMDKGVAAGFALTIAVGMDAALRTKLRNLCTKK